MKLANQTLKHYIETLTAECLHARDSVEHQACKTIIAKLSDIHKRGIRPDGARLSNYIDTLKAKMQSAISVNDYQMYKCTRQKLKQIRKQL